MYNSKRHPSANARTRLAVMILGLLGPITGCAENGSAAPEDDQAKNVHHVQPDDPQPPASAAFVKERNEMVTKTIERPWGGSNPVKSKVVLDAMRTVPRHAFVPRGQVRHAYADSPLPIGQGQTISQPYIVALMTQLLELTPESKVLEIGTGSGYQAAVLAHLTPYVYSIEIIAPLAKRAAKTLRAQGYKSVKTRRADGYFGWPEQAPFDAIIVTCAAGHLPPPLWEQLKPGGRIVIPIGGPYEVQRLIVVTKTPEGKRESKTVLPVRFVPMTRANDRGD
ncbi:MAG: protein-L-isoaspartate(D-aspartate) O-methyltransferase [Phycisphaerae bacterium]|jgi:protein-L-isoaspartate(D-aspartate) O-methyltransferase